MTTDRTTKLLLAVIALFLGIIALRPLVSVTAQAQEPRGVTPALALGSDGVYVAFPKNQGGSVLRFERQLGTPKSWGNYGAQ